MKTKLKIVNENGMYVGYALKNDEVVFKTNPCKDTISCSRALSNYTGNQTNHTSPLPSLPKRNRITQSSSPKPNTSFKHVAPLSAPSSKQAPRPASPAPAPAPAPRRCCGRG